MIKMTSAYNNTLNLNTSPHPIKAQLIDRHIIAHL